MQKNISKLSYFLFQKEHKILENKRLFRFQSEFAEFATTVSSGAFFGKTSEGIRPFLNQQLKVEGCPGSKPIKNHFSTYSVIVETRFKQLKPSLADDELKSLLQEFKEFFNKESFYKHEDKLILLFDVMTVKLLKQLQIVAVANGGALTQEEFIKALINLKNQPLDHI
ncbi:hypothetical protein IT403_01375 [Candidatus Nomurabacteria bacterium]|nr:hypothetical protein [Candidatus Nomurabacteria bacterium]